MAMKEEQWGKVHMLDNKNYIHFLPKRIFEKEKSSKYIFIFSLTIRADNQPTTITTLQLRTGICRNTERGGKEFLPLNFSRQFRRIRHLKKEEEPGN